MSTVVSDLVSYLQCGSSISLNDAVYIDSATGKVFKFDPTNSALLFAGIAKEAGVLNDYIRIVQSGRVKGFAGLTVGALVYASVVTPGSFQLTVPPSSQSVILGIAKSATELVINGALGIKPGGSASGSGVSLVNSLLTQSLEAATLADFTQTGLSLSTSNPINGSVSAQLIHQAVTTQSFKQVIAVNNKFKGYSNTLSLSVRSSALAANLTLLVRDETNSVNLLASTQVTTGQITSAVFNTATSTTVTVTDNSILNQLKVGASITGSGIATGTVITAVGSSGVTISQAATATATGVSLKVSLLPATQSFSFPIPTNCSSISYTISALAEAGLPETYIDDVQVYLSEIAKISAIAQTNVPITITQSSRVSAVTAPISGTSPNIRFGANISNRSDIINIFDDGTNTKFIALVPCTINISCSAVLTSGNNFYVRLNGVEVQYSNANAYDYQQVMANLTLNTGDYVTITTYSSLRLAIAFYTFTATAQSVTTINSQAIPLTSSVIVTQPDSSIRLNTTNGYGSTNTYIKRFLNIVDNFGSDITYFDSPTLGASFTVNTGGVYNISYIDSFNINSSSYVGLSKNSTQLSTAIFSVNVSDRLALSYMSVSGASGTEASWSGYLSAGDIIRAHVGNPLAAGVATDTLFTISKVGSAKILNPSSDQKIVIPTHQLRFEGASARGSTDTAIVKFDTQTITQGDGFTVVNTAANGTVVTIKKAGMLSVSTSLVLSSGSSRMGISVNQSVLTSVAVASEIRASDFSSSVTTGASATSSFPVNIGDVVRIFAGSAITLDAINNLSLSLQEQTVAVALQNVLPTFDQSDSCVQLRTANGYGSTNTKIRRFSNTVQNFGTDITYVDDASLGGSFTVNKDGVYNISYTDLFASVQNMGITKNSAELTTSVQTLTVPSSILTAVVTPAANYSATASTSVYLIKGDVIRAHTTGVASGTDVSFEAKFTISKVGKTSGTVDVTPFVQIPTQDVEAIEALTATSTFGSTNTGIPVLNITKNTNKGIIQVVSDSVNGTSFKALKDCKIDIGGSAQGSVAADVYITRNATILTSTVPDGVISVTDSGGASFFISSEASVLASAGDIFRIQRSSTNLTSFSKVLVTAVAISTSIVTPTQQVSSDTMSFAFQATALTGSEAIGTFNTYTYAASSNTATISATAPTQATSSMNTNGVQVFGRAYNAASTTASPARVEVFIGKGLRANQVSAYANTNKTGVINYDIYGDSNFTEMFGTRVNYDETTGILILDAAVNGSTNTSRSVGLLATTGRNGSTSGYFVFNSSKIPALVSIPNQFVTMRAYGSSTTISASLTTVNFSTTDFDPRGAYSAGTYTIPTGASGKYQVNAALLVSGTIALNNTLVLEIQKNGVVVSRFTEFLPSTLTSGKAIIDDIISCSAGDTIRIQVSTSITGPAIVSSSFDNYFSLAKVGV